MIRCDSRFQIIYALRRYFIHIHFIELITGSQNNIFYLRHRAWWDRINKYMYNISNDHRHFCDQPLNHHVEEEENKLVRSKQIQGEQRMRFGNVLIFFVKKCQCNNQLRTAQFEHPTRYFIIAINLWINWAQLCDERSDNQNVTNCNWSGLSRFSLIECNWTSTGCESAINSQCH